MSRKSLTKIILSCGVAFLACVALERYLSKAYLDIGLAKALFRGDTDASVKFLDHGADPNVCISKSWDTMQELERIKWQMCHSPDVRQCRLPAKSERTLAVLDYYDRACAGSPCDQDASALLNAFFQHGLKPNTDEFMSLISKAAARGDSSSLNTLLAWMRVRSPGIRIPAQVLVRVPNEQLSSLIRYGIDINGLDQYGQTPLIVAIAQKDSLRARVLLDLGASVSAVDAHGEPPIVAAALWHCASLKLLIRHHANVNQRDIHTGATALMVAVGANDARHKVDALLSAGADVSMRATDGRTALDWAKESGNRGVIARLRIAMRRQSIARPQTQRRPVTWE